MPTTRISSAGFRSTPWRGQTWTATTTSTWWGRRTMPSWRSCACTRCISTSPPAPTPRRRSTAACSTTRTPANGCAPFRWRARRRHWAIALLDLDHDGRRDILIGNDYDTPDYVYLNTEFGWRLGQPFVHTTFNTMGYAEGDVDNDGTVELLAADMQPYREGADVDAAWAPIWNGSARRRGTRCRSWPTCCRCAPADGSYVNRAPESGLAATGLDLVGAVRRPGPRRPARRVRRQWHDRHGVRSPARRRTGRRKPGAAQRRRRSGGWTPPRAGAAWRWPISTWTATSTWW